MRLYVDPVCPFAHLALRWRRRPLPDGGWWRSPTLLGTISGVIHLRRAGPEDVEQVLALWARAGENDDRPGDDRAVVDALLARDPEALLLAEDDGELVGTLIAGWDGWRAHLYRLAVHPAHRRRGVATELLRAAEDRLVALGARRLDAMVLEGNADGQALWERAGFRSQERWRRWVRPVD